MHRQTDIQASRQAGGDKKAVALPGGRISKILVQPGRKRLSRSVFRRVVRQVAQLFGRQEGGVPPKEERPKYAPLLSTLKAWREGEIEGKGWERAWFG